MRLEYTAAFARDADEEQERHMPRSSNSHLSQPFTQRRRATSIALLGAAIQHDRQCRAWCEGFGGEAVIGEKTTGLCVGVAVFAGRLHCLQRPPAGMNRDGKGNVSDSGSGSGFESDGRKGTFESPSLATKRGAARNLVALEDVHRKFLVSDNFSEVF